MSVEPLLNGVRALSDEERDMFLEKLHEEYLESEPDATDELNALLDERAADADANPGVGYTIAEVAAYLKRPRA